MEQAWLLVIQMDPDQTHTSAHSGCPNSRGDGTWHSGMDCCNILAAAHLMDQVIDSEASHPQMARAKVTRDERGEDILSCECDFKI